MIYFVLICTWYFILKGQTWSINLINKQKMWLLQIYVEKRYGLQEAKLLIFGRYVI